MENNGVIPLPAAKRRRCCFWSLGENKKRLSGGATSKESPTFKTSFA